MTKSEFVANPNRDAWATIRGYVYQVNLTIEHWLQLGPAQSLQLERGEDIDVVTEDLRNALSKDATACKRLLGQVKHRQGSITLRTSSAISAIANFLEHLSNNPNSNLEYCYITNAQIGKERASKIPHNLPGISAWEEIRLGKLHSRFSRRFQREVVDAIREILDGVRKPTDLSDENWERFGRFVDTASRGDMLNLIKRFQWNTHVASTIQLSREITQMLIEQRYASNLEEAEAQYRTLFLYVFKLLSQPGIKELTLSELRAQVETTLLSPMDAVIFNNMNTMLTDLVEDVRQLTRVVDSRTEQILVDTGYIRNTVGVLLEDRTQEALRDFLRAMRSYCEELPYVTLPGKPLPPLSPIYVQQHATKYSGKKVQQALQLTRKLEIKSGNAYAQERVELLRAMTSTMTIKDALLQHENLILVAEAGMGKSTIVNYLTLQLTENFSASPHEHMIPVRVSARGLAKQEGSLSESLYSEIRRVLGKRLQRPLPRNFFAHPPSVGTKWLILLDGLDEIVEPLARENLISELLPYIRDTPSNLRFVITTRPIPELSALAIPHTQFFRIRGFEPYQVSEFLQKWSDARGNWTADDISNLLKYMAEKRLTEIAATPLLLTMATLLYELAPGRELPNGRWALYENFVSIVLEDEEITRNTRKWYRKAWMNKFGKSGEDWADHILNNSRSLLEHLATLQQNAPDTLLLNEAMNFLCSSNWVPGDVDVHWLRSQTEILLQRTGILFRTEEDYQFLHETFREYLAAVKFANTHKPSDLTAPCDLVDDPTRREILLFAMELWSAKEQDLTQLVERILAGRQRTDSEDDNRIELQRLLFVATALSLGARASEALKDKVTEALVTSLQEGDAGSIQDCAIQLSLLTALWARDSVILELLSMAENSSMSVYVRLAAMFELARWGAHEEALSLVAQAAQEGSDAWLQVNAAVALESLASSSLPLDILLIVASDNYEEFWIREDAVTQLEKLQQTEYLQVILCDNSIDMDLRELVFRILEGQGLLDSNPDLLFTLLADDTLNDYIKESTLNKLRVVDPEGLLSSGWLAVVLNGKNDIKLRIEAAERINRSLWEADRIEALATIVCWDELYDHHRDLAIAKLHELARPAVLSTILTRANDMSRSLEERFNAIEALEELGAERLAVEQWAKLSLENDLALAPELERIVRAKIWYHLNIENPGF